MATNQFDLVVCFERNRPGGPDENTYTARQASALCEWSLTVQRLDANDFRVALECEQTTMTRGNVALYTGDCSCLGERTFAELNDLTVEPGAVVSSKERFTAGIRVSVIGARISMHGSQRASVLSAMPSGTYDFADRSPACDVQIRVSDKLFYANKGLVLEELEPKVFEAFLKSVYPGGDEPTAATFADLMELAERYDVKFLRNKCERICRQRTDIPLVDRLTFAVHYRLSEFEDYLIESMNAAAARQLASEENLASLDAQCMQKLFVKCTKFSSNGTA